MANDPIVDAIIALLQRPKEGVMEELDEAAEANPLVADKIVAFKAFLGKLYDILPGRAVEGFREVVALIQTGSGPVSHDDVDVA